MEIYNIYINTDNIKNILNFLDLEDKISFTICNKTIYNNFYDDIKKEIYKYVNIDYKYFKRCINTFKYDKQTIKTLGLLAIANPNVVWGGYMVKYYDLRYIFELIMQDLDINDSDIININNHVNIRFMLITLKNCKSFNRFETKNNIQKQPCLRTLHYDFTLFPPCCTYTNNNLLHWTQI